MVVLDDALAHGKAKARAGFLGGAEGVEHAGTHVLGDAGAGVGNGQPDLAVPRA